MARRTARRSSATKRRTWQSTASTTQQKEAIRKRTVLDLIDAGGNIYYLAKFAGIFGLDVQDVGAQQTGMTKDEFKAMLAKQGA